MSYDILNSINNLDDLRALGDSEADSLCNEIREFLLDKVAKSGGHLGSNLGVVELSVAMHRVFDSPKDHIIFDVGHQSYVHKILTGRKDRFDDLRKTGGLSGFTTRRESEHDPFGAGHSSTSISAALGFAESDKLAGSDAYSIAVVGDGAYTGGMIHEAINNCKPDLRLIVVLNENGMSISSNKGVFASYVSRFRTSRTYIDVKEGARSLLRKIPLLGKPIAKTISAVKRVVKQMVYETNYFEELGFYYIGPIDGNDRAKVEKALRQAKALKTCVFVHIKTTKGKGADEADSAPDRLHSVSSKPASKESFHSVFADALIDLAEEKKDIVAVTPAMGIGTGLSAFEEKYPDRYYDVGIAEGHALTFSAGLAANGCNPFTAIYSTFLQRGYDSIVHDIALQGLPVKMFIDRAGLAVSDGPTHHGIFDVSFLSHIPNVEILAPVDYKSTRACVNYAYGAATPIAVRYPNSHESETITTHPWGADSRIPEFVRCDFNIDLPPRNIFITYGQITEKVIKAQNMLRDKGIECGIIVTERIKPYEPITDFILKYISPDVHIVYVEEGIKNGGAAMITENILLNTAQFRNTKFEIAAINDFATPSIHCDLYDYVGLSPEKLAAHFIVE